MAKAVRSVVANGRAAVGRAMAAMLFPHRNRSPARPMHHRQHADHGVAMAARGRKAGPRPSRGCASGATGSHRRHSRYRNNQRHRLRVPTVPLGPMLNRKGLREIPTTGSKKIELVAQSKKGGRTGGLVRPPLPGEETAPAWMANRYGPGSPQGLQTYSPSQRPSFLPLRRASIASSATAVR